MVRERNSVNMSPTDKGGKGKERAEDSLLDEDGTISETSPKKQQRTSKIPPRSFVTTLVGQIKIPSKFYNEDLKPNEQLTTKYL